MIHSDTAVSQVRVAACVVVIRRMLSFLNMDEIKMPADKKLKRRCLDLRKCLLLKSARRIRQNGKCAGISQFFFFFFFIYYAYASRSGVL